jgi:DNA-binding transcriptional ArsR family regulator
MRRITLEQRARILRALGTESRMQIIEVLKQGPLDVGDLAQQLGISQSAVSQHLKVLKELELVIDQRHSYFISYSLNPREFARLEEVMMRVCHISCEQTLKRRRYERQLKRERLVQLRNHLRSQLGQVEETIAALDEEEE